MKLVDEPTHQAGLTVTCQALDKLASSCKWGIGLSQFPQCFTKHSHVSKYSNTWSIYCIMGCGAQPGCKHTFAHFEVKNRIWWSCSLVTFLCNVSWGDILKTSLDDLWKISLLRIGCTFSKLLSKTYLEEASMKILGKDVHSRNFFGRTLEKI